MELDDVFGNTSKTPPNFKFVNVGDTAKLTLTEDGKVLPVHNFVKGKRGEQLFWQNQKVVPYGDLDKNLQYDPVKQILIVGADEDGQAWSIWADGEKMKALRLASREAGGLQPLKGMRVALKFTEELDTGAPYPKKLYKAQIKLPLDKD